MLKPDEIKQLRRENKGRNRVAKAMELSGITQVELAAAIGTTQSNISEIKTGQYEDLPLETTRALADHFGCSIEDLFPAARAIAS